MASKLKVSLVTPLRQVARKEVDAVTAPTSLGEVTILPNHRNLIADLKAGVLVFKAGDKADIYAVSGGFIEVVEGGQVTVLAETAEAAHEIDLKRSEQALEEATELLKKTDYVDPEYAEQEARAKRAEVRIRAAAN